MEDGLVTDGKSEALAAMEEKPIKVYLAAPYSHPDHREREKRFVAACRAADALMREGLVVFSPLSHSHPIEVYREDGKVDGGDFWLRQDFPFLDACDVLVVLCSEGWRESKGIQAEIARVEMEKPVVHWLRYERTPAKLAHDVRTGLGRRREQEKPEPILAEAARITSTERQRDYGHPRENFAAIAGMWNAYLGAKKDSTITPSDVAALMIQVKVAREANSPKRDNAVDIAGYARCLSQCNGFEE